MYVSEIRIKLQSVTAFQLHETLLFLYREIVHHLARSDDESSLIFEYLLKGTLKIIILTFTLEMYSVSLFKTRHRMCIDNFKLENRCKVC